MGASDSNLSGSILPSISLDAIPTQKRTREFGKRKFFFSNNGAFLPGSPNEVVFGPFFGKSVPRE